MATDSGNIVVGAATVSIGGTDVGYTQGGVQISHSPTFVEVEADQKVGIAKIARSIERMYLRFTMLEVTLANLRTALMYPSSNLVSGGSKLYLGYNDACWVDEKAIVIVGKAPDCGTRTWTFSRCILKGEREISMTRDNPAMLAVEFEVLKDDTTGYFGDATDS